VRLAVREEVEKLRQVLREDITVAVGAALVNINQPQSVSIVDV